MKASTQCNVAAVLLFFVTTTTACVQAYISHDSCFGDDPNGNQASLSIYDDGALVCHIVTDGGSSIDEEVCVNDTNGCLPGFSACVAHDLSSATYSNPDYSATLTQTSIQLGAIPCGMTVHPGPGGGVPLHAATRQACFSDNYGNCGEFPGCQVCGEDLNCSPICDDPTRSTTPNAVAVSWSGDNCAGSSLEMCLKQGQYRCANSVPGASIVAQGFGCTVTTWSGINCEGSSFIVPDSNCHAVPFGSWSIQC